MLDLVADEAHRIDSRFLEPACGSGNFLVPVLERKLSTVQTKFGKSRFETLSNGIFALMCIYGIDILKDNINECRTNLSAAFQTSLGIEPNSEWANAAETVLKVNIIQGDALSMTTTEGDPLTFPEWSYLGKGKYQRSDFLYSNLTQRSSYKGTLFEEFDDHEIFTPIRTYPSMGVPELAELGNNN